MRKHICTMIERIVEASSHSDRRTSSKISTENLARSFWLRLRELANDVIEPIEVRGHALDRLLLYACHEQVEQGSIRTEVSLIHDGYEPGSPPWDVYERREDRKLSG
jgi:hypothetical protein